MAICRLLKIESCIIKVIIYIYKYKVPSKQTMNIPNKTVYWEIEPVVSLVKKNLISFLGHLIKTPQD